jgi:hypothetical protein
MITLYSDFRSQVPDAMAKKMNPSAFGVEVSPIDVRDADEIERALTIFARSSNSGLVPASGLSISPTGADGLHSLTFCSRIGAPCRRRFIALGVPRL